MSFEFNVLYYIRGIVSLTSSRKDKELCNSEGYVVFTDVAKYLPWINEEVTQAERQPIPQLMSSFKTDTATHLVEPQPQYPMQPQYQPEPFPPPPTYSPLPTHQPINRNKSKIV